MSDEFKVNYREALISKTVLGLIVAVLGLTIKCFELEDHEKPMGPLEYTYPGPLRTKGPKGPKSPNLRKLNKMSYPLIGGSGRIWLRRERNVLRVAAGIPVRPNAFLIHVNLPECNGKLMK